MYCFSPRYSTPHIPKPDVCFSPSSISFLADTSWVSQFSSVKSQPDFTTEGRCPGRLSRVQVRAPGISDSLFFLTPFFWLDHWLKWLLVPRAAPHSMFNYVLKRVFLRIQANTFMGDDRGVEEGHTMSHPLWGSAIRVLEVSLIPQFRSVDTIHHSGMVNRALRLLSGRWGRGESDCPKCLTVACSFWDKPPSKTPLSFSIRTEDASITQGILRPWELCQATRLDDGAFEQKILPSALLLRKLKDFKVAECQGLG